MEEELSNYLDWITEPSKKDKLSSCGKHTQITLYTNNTIQLIRFYCHRWDCPNCSQKKRAAISKKIFEVSPYWWKINLKGRSYQAVQKQIKRAGAEYIALGTGDNTEIFVNKKLDDAEIIAFQKLADSIEEILKQPAQPGEHRFKHSRGLFPTEDKSDPITHLKMNVMVNEPISKLTDRFARKGYPSSGGIGGYYIDLGEQAEAVLNGVLSEIKEHVEYKIEHQNTGQDQIISGE
jgi:hypothetical protein